MPPKPGIPGMPGGIGIPPPGGGGGTSPAAPGGGGGAGGTVPSIGGASGIGGASVAVESATEGRVLAEISWGFSSSCGGIAGPRESPGPDGDTIMLL